jgi:hypothetical protein
MFTPNAYFVATPIAAFANGLVVSLLLSFHQDVSLVVAGGELPPECGHVEWL